MGVNTKEKCFPFDSIGNGIHIWRCFDFITFLTILLRASHISLAKYLYKQIKVY